MPDLIFEKRDGVAYLTMNRPERRNALSPQMVIQLGDAWEEFRDDRELRVAILTGAGEEAFCAGGDLGRLIPLFSGARQPSDEWDRAVLARPQAIGKAVLRDLELYKPVISAINGSAMGGGTEIALSSDLRVAASTAVFGLPEPRSGILAAGGGTVRLPRQVPWCRAMEVLLLAGRVAAQEALGMGLVNRVVAPQEVMGQAEAWADVIKRNAPVALAKAKEAALRSSGVPLTRALEIESECAAEVMRTGDAIEGPRAFMEKRDPVFTGE